MADIYSVNSIRFDDENDVPYYRFSPLEGEEGVIHAVFTRLGGVSKEPFASLNLGHAVGDDPSAIAENYRRVYRAVGAKIENAATSYLVHGNGVNVVKGPGRYGKGDAMITSTPGVCLNMTFADCTPLLFYDPHGHAVGLAHGGWRSTVQNVAGETARAMMREFGCRASDLQVFIGPSIGPCCYEVGREVIDAVRPAFADCKGNGIPLLDRWNGSHAYFNMWEASRRQLTALGVEQVFISGICTACNTDHFFSHRAELGKTGRFGVILGLSR